MLGFIRCWRERGWLPIDAPAYRQAWLQYGGSVITHPDVVERLSDLAGMPVRYLGWHQNDVLQAAMPCWGRHLALSKDALKGAGKKRLFDLGNAEVILPIAQDRRVPVRQRVSYLSVLNHEQVLGARLQKSSWLWRVPMRITVVATVTTCGGICA